jgi:hypothetical protein
LYATVFGMSTGLPSTRRVSPPIGIRFSPVAVTMTSAGSSVPDVSRIPCSVNVSMVSVTTDARPSLIDRNRSPSGIRHIRWSHGL